MAKDLAGPTDLFDHRQPYTPRCIKDSTQKVRNNAITMAEPETASTLAKPGHGALSALAGHTTGNDSLRQVARMRETEAGGAR